MFAACSDIYILLDSYITNVNLPWGKTTGTYEFWVIFVFGLNFKATNPFDIFDKRKAKSFPIFTGVINYNIEIYILIIGLDNGKIIFHKGIESTDF